ncbi:MAG: PEP-CTERM sorting domain-containing protein [Opitutae bacterium]|nr:PEP-CTERM sorting domain-containing protein [Opitutae bacterium]
MKTQPTYPPTRASSKWMATGLSVFLLAMIAAVSLPAQTLYWDANSTTAGAGATPTGTWSTSGSSNRKWTTNSAGTASTVNWTSGRDAVFSAGTDAVNAFTVTVSGTQRVSSITVDEGTPTLSGGTIRFSDTSPDIKIGAGRTLIFSSALTSTGTGNNLNINTVSGYNGTLSLTNSLSLAGTVTLGGGTLALGGASYSFGGLNVTANSVIDLAGSTTLNLTNLTISAGVTLTIQNWQDTVDFIYTTNFTGATLDSRGTGTAGQIVFTGFTGADTIWQSYDHQVTPVPEPATYGAVLTGGLLAFATWRRMRRTVA